MGTRSLTHVIQTYMDGGKEKKNPIMTMYRQYDGYPNGMGLELAKFLNSGEMVNGIGVGQTNVFNGAGCLAAQLVAHFKQGPGGFYLYKPMIKNCGEEYVYEVYTGWHTKEIKLRVLEIGYMVKDRYVHKRRKLFSGTPTEFMTWLGEYKNRKYNTRGK